jgi:hypothetical protein
MVHASGANGGPEDHFRERNLRMDSRNFDSMVKSFGKNASRRGVLRGASVAALGALALALGRGQVAARPECTQNSDCAGSCPAGDPCNQPVCVKGNGGLGGGGNTCECADPCDDPRRPNCVAVVTQNKGTVARCVR